MAARNIFKKIARGGYSARVRFSGEHRGEMYFDQEWDIRAYGEAGKFTIGCLMNYQGGICYDRPSGRTIGLSLKVGDLVHIQPSRWNMRGKTVLAGVGIKVLAIAIDENGMTEVSYTTNF